VSVRASASAQKQTGENNSQQGYKEERTQKSNTRSEELDENIMCRVEKEEI
jgi:hypothetical protein